MPKACSYAERTPIQARVPTWRICIGPQSAPEAEGLLRIGVDRGEIESFIVLGNLLDETGRTDEAEVLYIRGFELGDAHCAYNLALVLQREGRGNEADEWLHRAAQAGDMRARASLAQP
jgi:hypothetical protein